MFTKMKAKEFLEQELEKIHREVPGIKIRYEFMNYTGARKTHWVQTTPEKLCTENETYLALEEQLEDEFLKQFPNQDLDITGQYMPIDIDMMDPHFTLGYNDFERISLNRFKIEKNITFQKQNNIIEDIPNQTYSFAA